MSENLRILAKYSARMSAGDYDAVYDVFAPDFASHVTPRVSPEAAGDRHSPAGAEILAERQGRVP